MNEPFVQELTANINAAVTDAELVAAAYLFIAQVTIGYQGD